jgi:antitoxin component YwqK of YwqJK toxin-antitoxin module
MITIKNKFGLLHSIDDQPSIVDNGNLYWHRDGKIHRENDMPSIIMNNGDKYWYINGVPSRSDMSLPYIEMSNGKKRYRLEDGGYKKIGRLREEWFNKNSEYNRVDGPAYIRYNENGNIDLEYYYLNGKIHREDGPASIQYYENGNIQCEYYYLNGEVHREDGPAVIGYNENGNICTESYYINGKYYSKKDYLKIITSFNSCNKMS